MVLGSYSLQYVFGSKCYFYFQGNTVLFIYSIWIETQNVQKNEKIKIPTSNEFQSEILSFMTWDHAINF